MNHTKEHSIRFINSSYDELFRIPDGGTIQVTYPDRTIVQACEYVDDYHTRIGMNLFHICQFAELLERNGGIAEPEPEILSDRAAWEIGRSRYLAIQECEDGWDYTLYDRELHEIDGGQLDDPAMTMREAREDILSDRKLSGQTRVEVDYDTLTEKAEQEAERSVLAGLKAMQEEKPTALSAHTRKGGTER